MPRAGTFAGALSLISVVAKFLPLIPPVGD
jgi:hypothetical protein